MVQFDMVPRDDEDGKLRPVVLYYTPTSSIASPFLVQCIILSPNRRSVEANALLFNLSEVQYATDGTKTSEWVGSKLGVYFEFRRSIIGRESNRGPREIFQGSSNNNNNNDIRRLDQIKKKVPRNPSPAMDLANFINNFHLQPPHYFQRPSFLSIRSPDSNSPSFLF